MPRNRGTVEEFRLSYGIHAEGLSTVVSTERSSSDWLLLHEQTAGLGARHLDFVDICITSLRATPSLCSIAMLTSTQSRCADILPVCARVDRLSRSTRGS